METQPSPERIFQVGLGFWPAKVLLAAIKLDVFTTLNGQALSARELGDRVGIQGRSARDFLDTLVSLNFLERRDQGSQSRYANTPETAAFLDRGSAHYLGGMLEMANDRLYPYWGSLEEALRTGEPQSEIKATGKPFFEGLYEDEKKLRQFAEAMAAVQMENFRALAEAVDFTPYKTVCDVGGANGAFSVVLAQKYPHLKLISFDLPAMEPLARETVEAAGLGQRIRLVPGDFFTDEFPAADAIFMGNILHDWNEANKRHLIEKAWRALPEGGAFLVLENVIDEHRRQNSFALMMSLNMLIEVGDGFNFSEAEFRQWTTEAGFQRCTYQALSPITGVLMAIK
ncbi:MAG: methyltransferase domain-containing protein [Calditrichaeota bacterium]|nr:MAG: methyltransferase domain-containing protein [Calditrichota bacterium]